jgi:hypothetical protein
VKRIFRYLPLVLLLWFTLPFAQAQSEFNLAVGFGSAQDKAVANGIEGNPNSTNFFGSCAAGSSTTCIAPTGLRSFMMGFRGDLMLWKKFGVGADVTFEPGKQNYVTYPASVIQTGGYNLQSRTTFFDFDGIVQPVRTKKAAVQLFAGIGGANLKFYANSTSTDAIIGSQSYSQYYGSSNHFQVNGGIGVNLFVTDSLFIRPQFEVHYVNNLSQFGSNMVTEETVWIGYNWGSH